MLQFPDILASASLACSEVSTRRMLFEAQSPTCPGERSSSSMITGGQEHQTAAPITTDQTKRSATQQQQETKKTHESYVCGGIPPAVSNHVRLAALLVVSTIRLPSHTHNDDSIMSNSSFIRCQLKNPSCCFLQSSLLSGLPCLSLIHCVEPEHGLRSIASHLSRFVQEKKNRRFPNRHI